MQAVPDLHFHDTVKCIAEEPGPYDRQVGARQVCKDAKLH